MSAFAADEVTGAGTFDFARTEGGGTDDTLRNLRAALVLGWRVESNWTDPLLFFIYTVARPIASLLLLVVMVQIIGGGANDDVRTFVVLGSALWAMLVAGIAGPAWSVLEDRERYRMLKYLYVSPATFLVLLIGRGGARLAAGAMGTVVALVFAVIVLGLRIDLATVDWALLGRLPRARARPDHRAGRAARGRLPPDATGELVLPRCVRRGHVPGVGRRVPAGGAAPGPPGRRPRQPHHLVDRRGPARGPA